MSMFAMRLKDAVQVLCYLGPASACAKLRPYLGNLGSMRELRRIPHWY